jgi:hypothetical protein
MKMSEVKIDPLKLEQGDWVDKIPEMAGLRLKVRGSQNKDWRKLQQRLINSVPRNKRVAGQLDPAEQDRISIVLLRDACLLDWDGIDGEDGKPLPYSKDQANEYLTNPIYGGKFRDAVVWASTVVAELQDAGNEEDVKN